MQLDSSGNPIPTYTQANVEAFALAYTGWTYPTQTGATLQKHNPAYWIGPMVPFESTHNETAKVASSRLAARRSHFRLVNRLKTI